MSASKLRFNKDVPLTHLNPESPDHLSAGELPDHLKGDTASGHCQAAASGTRLSPVPPLSPFHCCSSPASMGLQTI